MPCSKEQDKALAALILALTSPPILAMLHWDKPCQLHTDASELGAGVVITQIRKGSERVLCSHRWSRADGKRSRTKREVIAVLWAVDHFRPYVWGRRLTLITDCSALTTLFKRHGLSTKVHKWALRLIEYDMDLQRRTSTRHQLLDILSRLPCSESPGEETNEAVPHDTSTRQTYRASEGPVLNGVPLTEFGADHVDEPTAQSVVAVTGATTTP